MEGSLYGCSRSLFHTSILNPQQEVSIRIAIGEFFDPTQYYAMVEKGKRLYDKLTNLDPAARTSSPAQLRSLKKQHLSQASV